LRHNLHNGSLRRNSTFLIAGQAVNAGSGFIFWVICAHLYSTRDVGLATAFISFGILITSFTSLGLPNTIVRFLPQTKKKGQLFSAALLSVTALSVIGGIVAILTIKSLSYRLSFVKHDFEFAFLFIQRTPYWMEL
jgi:O-antigen/teichoic acid export membrane protein